MSYRTITIPYKEPIDALYYPANDSKGTIIYSHGLFSSKDAYKMHQIAPVLCERGYTVVSFSYTYTKQYGRQPLNVSLTTCAQELNAILEYAASNFNPNLHIIGSSMGGATALYYIATIPYIVSIKSACLIATPAFLNDVVAAIAPQGICGEYVTIGEYTITTRSLCQLQTIDLETLIPRIDVPVCIIHGQNDDVVPVAHAHTIQKNLCVPHTMHIISDGDHTLTSPKHVQMIMEYILSWLTLHP